MSTKDLLLRSKDPSILMMVTKEVLIAECADRGLDTSAKNKDELVAVLLAANKLIDDGPNPTTGIPLNRTIQLRQSVDITKNLKRFAGRRDESIHFFIDSINRAAVLAQWCDDAKIVAASNLLDGQAADWDTLYGRDINDWNVWVKSLKSYFGTCESQDQWRQRMAQRTQKDDESIADYVSSKFALIRRTQGDFFVTDYDKIRMTINGIRDAHVQDLLRLTCGSTILDLLARARELDDTAHRRSTTKPKVAAQQPTHNAFSQRSHDKRNDSFSQRTEPATQAGPNAKYRPGLDKTKLLCYRCQQVGHISSDCSSPDTRKTRCSQAICKKLGAEFLRCPSSCDEWKKIAVDFEARWNFPNCIGTLDGKHIQIRAPKHSGSQFFNYKSHFSFVFLAVCDSNYCFTMIDIGNYGRISYGGIFSNSWFGKQLSNGNLNLPPPSALAPNKPPLPYVIVADEAFPLLSYIMRPFPGRYLSLDKNFFNYRLSRARRIIENAFGILVARWRLLLRPIDLQVDTAIIVTNAIVCLHNYLKRSQVDQQKKHYCPPSFVDHEDDQGNTIEGHWRIVSRNENSGLLTLQCMRGYRVPTAAKDIRDAFMGYFQSVRGSLTWQEQYVMRTG